MIMKKESNISSKNKKKKKSNMQKWWRRKSINSAITVACIAGGSKQYNEPQHYDEKNESLSN